MAPPDDVERVGHDPDPRFTLANERTFLAWNRTAIALIGGGLAAGQLLDFSSSVARVAVAVPPILLGLVLALTSYRRWKDNERALRLEQSLPSTGPPWVLAVGIGVVGLVVLVAVIVDAVS